MPGLGLMAAAVDADARVVFGTPPWRAATLGPEAWPAERVGFLPDLVALSARDRGH